MSHQCHLHDNNMLHQCHLHDNTRHDMQLVSMVCHRLENQVRKETKRFGTFVVFGVPVWMLADAQMNHGGSNVLAQWFSHWKIRADDPDIMK